MTQVSGTYTHTQLLHGIRERGSHSVAAKSQGTPLDEVTYGVTLID